MRTSKCSCLIFGVSAGLDPGKKRTKGIFDRSKFKVIRNISPTISGCLLVTVYISTGVQAVLCRRATWRLRSTPGELKKYIMPTRLDGALNRQTARERRGERTAVYVMCRRRAVSHGRYVRSAESRSIVYRQSTRPGTCLPACSLAAAAHLTLRHAAVY